MADSQPKPGRFPDAVPACAKYDYIDPETASYAIARLPEVYHPLDAWQSLGKVREGHVAPLVFRYSYGAAIGFGSFYLYERYYRKRPWYSQIHKLFLALAFTMGVAHVTWVTSRTSAKNRDAALRHYLETHYDDFPVVHRRKFKDEFRPWEPRRLL